MTNDNVDFGGNNWAESMLDDHPKYNDIMTNINKKLQGHLELKWYVNTGSIMNSKKS